MGSRGDTALFHQTNTPESSGDGNMVQNNLSWSSWALNLVERRNLWLLPLCLVPHWPSLWALPPEPSQQSHLLKDTSEQSGYSSETVGSRLPCCSQIKPKFQQGSQVFLWARSPRIPNTIPVPFLASLEVWNFPGLRHWVVPAPRPSYTAGCSDHLYTPSSLYAYGLCYNTAPSI